MNDFVTRDSGERQPYASGMVRDTQEGKPRFDLLLADGVPYDEQFLTRCAALMTRGADKYGLKNWQKADSSEELERFRASFFRHAVQYLTGEDDGEDHAAACYFNLLAAITTTYKLRRASKVEAEFEEYSSPEAEQDAERVGREYGGIGPAHLGGDIQQSDAWVRARAHVASVLRAQAQERVERLAAEAVAHRDG